MTLDHFKAFFFSKTVREFAKIVTRKSEKETKLLKYKCQCAFNTKKWIQRQKVARFKDIENPMRRYYSNQ